MKHNNKKIILVLAVLMPIFSFAQNISLPPSGGNQKASVSQWMGIVKVSFTYNSPDVTSPTGEDRTGKIWGELVPWGMNYLGFGSAKESPWRAGANENTVFYTSHDVRIEGKDLPAGHYGFHIIPSENGPWTLIFSRDYTSWGSYFYDPAGDALRVETTPLDSEFNEWLNFGFDDRELESCTAYLEWENKKIPFRIEVPDIHEIYLARIREELKSSPGFNYMSWMQAASYCANNKINLEEALTWADQAISAPFIGQENFQTYQTKANVLNAMGKTSEADMIMDKAIDHGTASVGAIHQYARSLIEAGRNDKAMEVFQKNAKKHPEEKFTTNVGLARGYAALGDTKKAIKYWETALENIPEDQKPNLSYYESEVNKLKENL
jgi:tetratricopeptide (TPR) repeat protein